MAAWIIEKDSDVRQYWSRLRNRNPSEREAFEQAELLLSENPFPLDHSPGVIKHLKGAFTAITSTGRFQTRKEFFTRFGLGAI